VTATALSGITVPDSLLDAARAASSKAREAGLGGDDQLRAVVDAVLASFLQGRIVLDEVDEMGITDADEDRDLLLITNDAVKLNVHGPYYMDADEAEEWAAHLATMARALRAAKAGGVR
jgi:muconolactone delta-isomerase